MGRSLTTYSVTRGLCHIHVVCRPTIIALTWKRCSATVFLRPRCGLPLRKSAWIRHHGGHSHEHACSPEDSPLAAAVTGSNSLWSDRGSRIALIGLGSNIVLTAAKGIGGWLLNSASLVADAAHSLGDMLADLVTLGAWKLSKRPANVAYPYGYGKYDAIGSLTVSLLLVGAALGIGSYSFNLFTQSLLNSPVTLSNLPDFLLAYLPQVEDLSNHSHGIGHSHVHSHAMDSKAAYFAMGSVIVKEWLYRATYKVAKAEHSPVLFANAAHHRADAYTSAVALFAVGGTAIGLPLLDPLGGIIVAVMILRAGTATGVQAVRALLDRSTDPEVPDEVAECLRAEGFVVQSAGPLPLRRIEVVLTMSSTTTVGDLEEMRERAQAIVARKVGTRWKVVLRPSISV